MGKLKELLKLADDFDKGGFAKEADIIDNVIKFAQESNALMQVAIILNDQKFIESAKNSVETMKRLKDIADSLGGEYAEIKRDIESAIQTIVNANADVVPILNRAKNSTTRHIQQITQEKTAMNIDTLIRLSDALDKQGLDKFSNRIDKLLEKVAASPINLIKQRDLLQRKRRYHRRRMDALRRRGGDTYDRNQGWLGELITNLADQEDKIDEQLQRMADEQGIDDLEAFVRRERIKDRVSTKGLVGILSGKDSVRRRPRRPRRPERGAAQPPKKVPPGAKPMPDWMQKILDERMGVSGTDVERAGY